MNKESLIGLFTTGKMPEGESGKDALGNIVQSFPYFQMAQVLYARQMYAENDPEVTARLKLASIYAPDRKAMHKLFRETEESTGTVTEKTQPDADNKESKAEEIKYNFVYTTIKEEEVVADLPKMVDEDVGMKVIEDAADKKIEPNVTTSLSETFLEREIAAAAAVALTERKIVEQPVIEKVAETTAEKIDTGSKIATEKEKGATNFEGWLERMPMTEFKVRVPDSSTEVKPKAENKAALIDRFLENAPVRSRPKAEFFSPTKAAKLSLTDDNDLVSETLASIYVLQGNLPMALKAYETLLLQNPGKKAYFAARIKEVQRQIESGSAKNK